MINFIVTAVLAILVAVFGLLRTIWTGFAYFSLVALVAICLYWLFVLIKTYIYDFHKDINEKYKIYCAQIVNSTSINLEDIENNNDKYFAEFKKTLRKEKIFEILKMILVATLLITCVSLFFTGKLF